MTNTDNYNLLLVEGTDKYNPLTQVNPNFEDIDEIMKENADSSISLATEIKSGTVHAITRNNPDAAVFRFVATSAWTTGDTVEVDNVQVSTLKTDGTALETGDYIIGSNVIGILSGTTLTLLVNAKSGDASTLDGHAASYFATAEDLDGVSTVAEGAAEAAADNTIAINALDTRITNITSRVGTHTLYGVIMSNYYSTMWAIIPFFNASAYNFSITSAKISEGNTQTNITSAITVIKSMDAILLAFVGPDKVGSRIDVEAVVTAV